MSATKVPAFDRFAAAVADFGSPFYDEERQRDVWNEASAFGFQLFLWGSLLLAGTVLWMSGRPGLAVGLSVLALEVLASLLVIADARRLGVDPAQTSLSGGRRAVFIAVYGFVVTGVLRAVWAGQDASTVAGMTAGAVVGLAVALAAVFGIRAIVRRRPAAPDDDA